MRAAVLVVDAPATGEIETAMKALITSVVFVLAAALGLSALVPPLQSPDEHSHLMRGYLVSKGRLFLQNDPALGSGGMVDQRLLDYMHEYLATIAKSAQTPLPPQRRAVAEGLRWGGSERFFPLPGTNYYMPLAYAPHAAGMLAGRIMHLTVADTYRLVRLACIASCIVLLAAAWRVLRPPPIALALLLLPMTLFQLVSPTLDGVTTSLSVLALSLFLAGAAGDAPWTAARSWALAAAILLLATTRVQLLPLLVAPFYLAWARRSRRDAWLGAACVAATLAWLAYALATTVDVRVQRTHGTVEVLLHYAAAPLELARVLWRSVTDHELSRFYSHSFIGILGWLDTWLPLPAYPALWAGLALCAVASIASAGVRAALPARALLIGAAAACAVLVFLAMLLTWTPHPARTVDGVQGRYFIVPALVAAYALGAPPGRRPGGRVTGVLVACFAAVSLWALGTALLARYH